MASIRIIECKVQALTRNNLERKVRELIRWKNGSNLVFFGVRRKLLARSAGSAGYERRRCHGGAGLNERGWGGSQWEPGRARRGYSARNPE